MNPLILLFLAVGIGLAVVGYLLLSEKGKTQDSTTMSTDPGSAQKTDKIVLLLMYGLVGIGLLRAFVGTIIEIRADNPYAVVNVIICLALVIIVWNLFKWRKWALNALVVFLSVMIMLVVAGIVFNDEPVLINLIPIVLDGATIALLYHHRIRSLF